MKKLITISLLFASLTIMAQTTKEQKYFRVVEYFKPEEKYTYFHWSTDSSAQAKIANIKTDFGAIYKLESKIMTSKQAERDNKKMDKRIEKENYKEITGLN